MMSTEQPVPDEGQEFTQTHDAAPPEPEAAPSPTPTQEPPALTTYRVVGPQRLDEVAPGKTVDLDPDEPRTARLLARGQIVRVEAHQED